MGLKIILAIFSFLLGAVLASFAGVVAYRVPKKQSIVHPPSHCPNCQKEIVWYDNIPIFSYIILRGRCRFCKEKIGVFSFLCELFSGCFFAAAFLQYGISVHTLLVFVFIFVATVIAAIDFETHIVYNSTLIVFFAVALAICLYKILYLKNSVWDFVIGTAIGFVFFLLIKLVSEHVLKREALGSGDIYLSGIAGLMLGILPFVLSVTIASLTGCVVESVRLKRNTIGRETEIAFAPYLMFGFVAMAVWGTAVADFFIKVVM